MHFIFDSGQKDRTSKFAALNTQTDLTETKGPET